ncbi:MAG: hypothetical protein ACKOC6_07085, partial [bacterium]
IAGVAPSETHTGTCASVVHAADGSRHEVAGAALDAGMTRRWFARRGDVVRVEVRLPAEVRARD